MRTKSQLESSKAFGRQCEKLEKIGGRTRRSKKYEFEHKVYDAIMEYAQGRTNGEEALELSKSWNHCIDYNKLFTEVFDSPEDIKCLFDDHYKYHGNGVEDRLFPIEFLDKNKNYS